MNDGPELKTEELRGAVVQVFREHAERFVDAVLEEMKRNPDQLLRIVQQQMGGDGKEGK